MAHAPIRPRDVARAFTQHPRRIILPVVIATVLAGIYALVKPATWEAAQALVVRDEAGDGTARPGRFSAVDEMKTSQETILELARSRKVLSAALAEVGPPADAPASATWPTEEALESLQSSVKLSPPKGAEFGRTEVFYLKVQDASRERGVKLALAICKQVQQRFGSLREAKAQSTIDELTRTVNLAEQELNSATGKLQTVEQQVGSDLADLRILNESPAGDSDMRRTAMELDKELRTFRATQSEGEQFLQLLTAAKADPEMLVAAPSALVKSQPALGRLKDGLVDAQLKTGMLQGTMSEDHPLVQNAHEAEQAIRKQLHDEIAVAIRGLQVDLRVNADQISALEKQRTEFEARFARLATVRAEYGNLVSATKNRAENLKTVEHQLSEARASQAAAHTASLISLIDTPDTGTRPIGPGKVVIVLGGFAAGWAIALAIVFLMVEQQAFSQEPVAAPRVAAPPVAVPRAAAPRPATTQAPTKVLRAPAAVQKPERHREPQRSSGLTLKQALQRVAVTS